MKNVINFIKRKSTIILLIILLLLVAAAVALLGMFLPKIEGSVYGNRLDEVEKYQVTDEIKDSVVQAITLTEKTTSAKVTVNVRIINVNIKVKEEVTMEEAKKIYDSFKEKIPQELLSYYDLQVIITGKDYTTFGYVRSGRTEIKWTNNK